jgi:hypothetical protein
MTLNNNIGIIYKKAVKDKLRQVLMWITRQSLFNTK